MYPTTRRQVTPYVFFFLRRRYTDDFVDERGLWGLVRERSISIVSLDFFLGPCIAFPRSAADRVCTDWLPNHSLVIHVFFLFSILNPFIIPFGAMYFLVQSGVVKNQVSVV